MPAEILGWAEYKSDIRKEEKSRISEELKLCPKLEKYKRAKLEQFLEERGVYSISEMDYPLREKYEKYLDLSPDKKRAYLKCYDRVMQYVIQKQMQTLKGKRKYEWKYKNEIMFLRYYPDAELAEEFLDARNSEYLIWDFTRRCSEELKWQIFHTLTYILENVKNERCRKLKLLALQYFYSFCCENSV